MRAWRALFTLFRRINGGFDDVLAQRTPTKHQEELNITHTCQF
jgi:hypothetical protein